MLPRDLAAGLLECINQSVQSGVIESATEPRIFKIDEQRELRIEGISLQELCQQSRLAAATHPLDNERKVGSQVVWKDNCPRHCLGRLRTPVAPVASDLEEKGFVHVSSLVDRYPGVDTIRH